MLSKKTIRIITRESQLAMWQATWVKDQLEKAHPQTHFDIVGIKSLGDTNSTSPIDQIGGKFVFVKKLQNALIENQADIAVHCIKDMSVHPTPGLSLISVPAREDPRDALISNNNLRLSELPQGATVGTGSPRRASLLRSIRPDLYISPIRGNIVTRLNKLEQGDYDAIILACAGLNRLNKQHLITEILDPHWFVPAIGQGALGIECRSNDSTTQELVLALQHEPTFNCILAEQSINQVLNGDCHTAIGGFASYSAESLTLRAMLSSLDGKTIIKAEITSETLSPQQLGEAVANKLLIQGAIDLLQQNTHKE
jgi:hydroxymethylbilane synthase